MRNAFEGELGGNSWRIYNYIVRHFLASLAENMKYLQQTVDLSIGEEKFTYKGRSLISPGFSQLMPWFVSTYEDEEEEDEIGDFEFTEGQCFPIVSTQLKKGETTPPNYLTESELLGLMEKHGIGTDASMATFVHLICERGYVKISGNKRMLIPEKLGIIIIHGFYNIDKELVLPTIRSDMEKQVSLIAEGKRKKDEILTKLIKVYHDKFIYFMTNV